MQLVGGVWNTMSYNISSDLSEKGWCLVIVIYLREQDSVASFQEIIILSSSSLVIICFFVPSLANSTSESPHSSEMLLSAKRP